MDRLLLLAHRAVVGAGGPVLGSELSHILGTEMGVVYSPLYTAQLAVAVLMPGLLDLLPQSNLVPSAPEHLRVHVDVCEAVPGPVPQGVSTLLHFTVSRLLLVTLRDGGSDSLRSHSGYTTQTMVYRLWSEQVD